MDGFWGRILLVDLSAKHCSIRTIKEGFFKKYLGGVGVAAKLIFEEVDPKVEPLSPDNMIVFSVGPFQGTSVPGSGRWIVAAKSPLTNIWGESCAGGSWGYHFKRSGFDAIAIRGMAEKPTYLWICDGEVEFRGASDVWGKPTSETQSMIKKDLGERNASVLCIGPAGENLVKFACITNDHGFAGRCGLGAAMGSKNLKAIATKGTLNVDVAEPDRLKDLAQRLSKQIHEKAVSLREYGTTSAAKTFHDERGYGLAGNWREGSLEGIELIDGDHFKEITVSGEACIMCPIGCHRHTRVDEPEKYAYDGHGPEYETIGMIGWLNKIVDVKAIGYLGHICNEYGVDTITMGSIIGFVTECAERGWLTPEDLDGIKPRWGEADPAIELIHKTVKREGIGNILAEGTVKAAEHIHPEAQNIVVHAKGLEYPAHDPRAIFPLIINYATGARGACHQRGFVPWAPSLPISEWGIEKLNKPHSMDGAAEIAARYQDWSVLFNSLVQCEFMVWGGLTLSDQIAFLNHITGWNIDAAYMLKVAERIFTLQRIINVRFGISRKDDSAPPRMFEALKSGKSSGKIPVPFDKALNEYYRIRGWDMDGKPTVKKLIELELTEALKPVWE